MKRKKILTLKEKLILLVILLVFTFLYAQGDFVFCGLLLFVLMLIHGVHIFRLMLERWTYEYADYQYMQRAKYIFKNRQLSIVRVFFGLLVLFALLWLATAMSAGALILNSIGAVSLSWRALDVYWAIVFFYIALDAILLVFE